jgi:phosphatidylglycerophosphate synthase
VPRSALSARRLLGLDRSGPPPAQSAAGAPLRPWTVPNAIGYVRAALIPVFLILDYRSAHGTDALAAVCFFVAAAGDYADGIAARITGQYSRLGALLDPLLDRLLVLAGVAVCWSYELLPRWLLVVVVVRETLMLALSGVAMRRGLTLRINWPGRIAVGPTMLGVWLALLAVRGVGLGFVLAGTACAGLATVVYVRDGLRQARASSSA